MDKNQHRMFLVLKILAPIILTLGIVLIILGTAIFPEKFNGNTVAPNAAYFAPGMILLSLSIPCFIAAFIPEINKAAVKTAKHILQDNKEDLTDIADTSADIISGGVIKTTSAIKKGISKTKFCKYCGKEIDADSKFCNECGKQQ